MKAIKWLDEHLEEVLLVILLVLITCVELIQVVIRNIPWIPALTWAEEFCRFCWIWSVFISLPYTLRKSSMLRVNVLMDLLPSVVRNSVNILVDLINAGVMALLGYHSISVISSIMISAEASPAMLWPMWMVYSVMVFGFFFGAVRALQQAVIHIKNIKKKELSTIEQTIADAAEEAAAGKRAEGGEA